jgi:hypothetical protein
VQPAEAEVRCLEAELAFVEDELRRATVYSPADGVVVTPYLKNRVGQLAHRGDLLCFRRARTTVEITVPEKEGGRGGRTSGGVEAE